MVSNFSLSVFYHFYNDMSGCESLRLSYLEFVDLEYADE